MIAQLATMILAKNALMIQTATGVLVVNAKERINSLHARVVLFLLTAKLSAADERPAMLVEVGLDVLGVTKVAVVRTPLSLELVP